MEAPHTLSGDNARAALESSTLVPPPAPASIGSGSLAALRDGMARFSAVSEHSARREAVERAIGRIDPDDLERCATQRSVPWQDKPGAEWVVPTEALALQLGIEEAALADVVADTERIVRVIGRGEAANPEAEAACDRMLQRLAAHPDGSVAAMSLLYQVHDATAALFAATQTAQSSASPRQSALVATVRVATCPIEIDGYVVAEGDLVRLSLASLDLEFGAGPHGCPGRSLAEAIVHGMTRR